MRKFAIVSVMVLGVVAGSCKKSEDDRGASGVDAGSFDKAALLRAFGECALGGYRDFHTAAVELAAAAEKADVEATPAARDAARTAWKKAIDAWQIAEAFSFGPAAKTGAPGGHDMRDAIYSWPLVNRCAIEQAVVAQSYVPPGLSTALVNTRGMAALDFLLFDESATNGCDAAATINTDGSWAALGAPEIQKRKIAYARAASVDVVARGQALVDAWDPAKGNFLGEMSGAGSTKTFASQQMAFNVVSDALFYTDIEVKNLKVGIPAGLVLGACATPPCLASVESPWAKRSKDHIRNNLIGFERLTRGCGPDGEGLGFEELLAAIGAGAVGTKINASVTEIRASLDALAEPTFEDDLTKNPAGVKRLFDALRALATVLKSDFVTVLDLEIPKPVEGDND